MTTPIPPQLDHLMWGGADLEALVEDFTTRTGVVPEAGGRHARLGTHNRLVGLGGSAYLELIAPDPHAETHGELAALLARLETPRLVCWAIAVDELEPTVRSARERGYDPGPAMPLARETPTGEHLAWHVCFGGEAVFLGVVPFLIAWGSCPHPTTRLAHDCRITALAAEHPTPTAARSMLQALAVELPLTQGTAPRLTATLETPHGTITLC